MVLRGSRVLGLRRHLGNEGGRSSKLYDVECFTVTFVCSWGFAHIIRRRVTLLITSHEASSTSCRRRFCWPPRPDRLSPLQVPESLDKEHRKHKPQTNCSIPSSSMYSFHVCPMSSYYKHNYHRNYDSDHGHTARKSSKNSTSAGEPEHRRYQLLLGDTNHTWFSNPAHHSTCRMRSRA